MDDQKLVVTLTEKETGEVCWQVACADLESRHQVIDLMMHLPTFDEMEMDLGY